MSQRAVVHFTLRDVKVEELHESIVFSVKYCEHYPSLWSHFAAAGSTTVSIYRVDDIGTHLLRHYVDEDCKGGAARSEDGKEIENKDAENYYSVTWATCAPNQPCVVAGGKRGILKVINVITHDVGVLRGHGKDIMELKTHTKDDGLVLSASNDFSVRLWNIRSLVCIAVFGGENGHRGDVVSLDVHLLGNIFVSAGLDTTIKIWDLQSPELLRAIAKSDDPQPSENRNFKTIYQQLPLFSTHQIHGGYVDSVSWVGDNILSKSTHNRLALWVPDAGRYRVRPFFR